jgi:hypothetical protein
MRGWTLDKLWDLNFDGQKVSDGGTKTRDGKPTGRLVAYPTTALFVRNVRFKLDEWASHSDYMQKQVSGGGCVAWGPFCAGGSYARGTETRNGSFHIEGGEIFIPGIQLIGFTNNLVPNCPNLHPDIKPEQLVGGSEEQQPVAA